MEGVLIGETTPSLPALAVSRRSATSSVQSAILAQSARPSRPRALLTFETLSEQK